MTRLEPAAGATGSIGDRGEREVIRLVGCPNCGKRLMQLPANYPLYDVQCTGCSFRAQVKTVCSPPKNTIRGAGWDIICKVLKSGFLAPPLIVNFKWPASRPRHRVILFFAFIPVRNMGKYQLSPSARQPGYRMFNYTGLLGIPHATLFDTTDGRWRRSRE